MICLDYISNIKNILIFKFYFIYFKHIILNIYLNITYDIHEIIIGIINFYYQ